MKKSITFRHMEHSAPMEQHADKQLAKLIKFLENEPTPVYLDLVFEPSKVHQHHRIELRVKSSNYDRVSSYEHQGSDFYETLDRVIDVMYKELHEDKKRQHDELKQRGRHDDFKKQR